MSAAQGSSISTPVGTRTNPRGASRPEVAARLLGQRLRELRRQHGLGLKQVAPVIRGSVSKISRLERGESPARERDVDDLLRFYGADEEQAEEIAYLLRQSAETKWWRQYEDVTPRYLTRLIEHESSAHTIWIYENHVVPGLLQIPEYARALVSAALPGADNKAIERRVELRMARQEQLHRKQRGRIVALLDESVLRRPVGGREVMRKQLEHLRLAASLVDVSIRFIRFAAGASVAPNAPITHLEFRDGGPAELVYLEQVHGASYVTRQADLERYRQILARINEVACSRRESMWMLEETLRRYRRPAQAGD